MVLWLAKSIYNLVYEALSMEKQCKFLHTVPSALLYFLEVDLWKHNIWQSPKIRKELSSCLLN